MHPFETRFQSRSAFTLVELLVVILVIGILIAVAAPSFLGQAQKAHDANAKQNLAVAYRAAKASAVDRDGEYVNAGFTTAQLAAALKLSEPQLDFKPGSCPSGVTTDPSFVIIDELGTTDNDLKLCNDPELRVWTLTSLDYGPPTFALDELEGSGAAESAVANVSQPTISGTPQEGVQSSVSNGSWSGNPTSYTYQWQRSNGTGWTNVGSDASTFIPSAAEIGETLRATVTASRLGSSSSATAEASTPVLAANSAPINTALPALSGSSALGGGSTSVSNGAWSGSPAPTFAYAWQRFGDYQATVQGSQPSLYLRLGDASGSTSAADRSGNGLNGSTASGVTFGTAGKPVGDANTAATFTGGVNGFSIPDSAMLRPATITVEAWIKTTASARQFILWKYAGSGGRWALEMNSAVGKAQFLVESSGSAAFSVATSTTSVNDGLWHHLAGTYDGAGVKIYIDGALEATTPSTLVIGYDTNPAEVGRFDSSFAGYGFVGTIDEIAVYPRALPLAELQGHSAAAGTAPAWVTIAGAASSSYTAITSDRSRLLRATVTATNSVGSSSTSTAAQTLAQPVNLLTDGSFEAGGSWWSISGGSPTPAAVVSTASWSGSNAVSVTADTGEGNAVSPFLPIDVLKSYTVAASFRQDSGTANAGAAIYLAQYNAAGTYLSARFPNELAAGMTYPSPAASFQPTSNWTRYGGTFSSGAGGSDWAAGTTQVRLVIRLVSYPSPQVRVRADAIGLYAGSFAAAPYAP